MQKEEKTSHKRRNFKKSQKNFGRIKKSSTFVNANETHPSAELNGSLAQLVQSVCLTSRGSGVRLPQLPQKTLSIFTWSLFL